MEYLADKGAAQGDQVQCGTEPKATKSNRNLKLLPQLELSKLMLPDGDIDITKVASERVTWCIEEWEKGAQVEQNNSSRGRTPGTHQ